MATLQYTKYNEQEYEFEMYLDSNAGTANDRVFPINPNAIVNLNIEETLADWIVKGTLTVYDSFNTLENTPITPGILGEGPTYVFRNDGNDILHIRLFPRLDKLNLEVDQIHWELVYKFSIYDVEDIDLPPGAQNQASAVTKCKKFYFWDYWYQQMITNTLEYSTGLSRDIPGASSTGPLTDEQRSLPTGIAMKEIIDQSLGTNLNNRGTSLNIAGGPNNEWDSGAFNIFYTAPATNSAFDTLMDVYNRHISSTTKNNSVFNVAENDFCILSKSRGPSPGDEGYLTLIPMSEYFEKAGKDIPGEYQIEHFYVQDYAPSEKIIPKLKRSPILGQQNLQKDTSLGAYSQITSYRFVDISPFTNATVFTNKPVYSFDFLNRTFNVDFTQNTVETARDFIVQKYINQLAVSRDNSKDLFLLTLEESKKNKNIKPIYSLYGGNNNNSKIGRQADGLQKLLKTGVFQNACINFRCLGSTNREPGRFIAIDKQENIEDNNFNNKLFGQWFIINVCHIFEAGLYYNDITAIKLHRFKSLDVNIPGTI